MPGLRSRDRLSEPLALLVLLVAIAVVPENNVRLTSPVRSTAAALKLLFPASVNL